MKKNSIMRFFKNFQCQGFTKSEFQVTLILGLQQQPE
ncbi:conserved hypothetical protein, partial [delta proteobacterium NaphS2]